MAVAIGTVLALCSAPTVFGDLEKPVVEKKGAKKPSLRKRAGKKELVWSDLDKGLETVRTKYLPIVIWYDGSEEEKDAGKGGFSEVLGHSSLASNLRKYVLIRVRDTDLTETYRNGPSGPRDLSRKALAKAKARAKAKAKNPKKVKPNAKLLAPKEEVVVQVGDQLRLPAGQPALLLLDYRERVVERFDGELPKRTKLSSRLRHVAKANSYFAKKAFAIEKVLVEAQRVYLVGNTRAAVLRVRGLESEKARQGMDPVLQGWSAKTIETYRSKARKLLAEAEELEKEGDKLRADSSLKYNKALKAFAKVAQDYPFKDVAEKANRRRADILRKMTVTGENPFR